MYGIVLLVLVAVLSLLVTRVATVALTTTGMTRESARFQARSALTGAGFTTGESEMVVNHRVRRRIVMGLMLLGSVGLVTAVAGMLGGFVGADGAAERSWRGVFLVTALTVVYLVSLSSWVDRKLSRLIMRVLSRYTSLEVHDYARLLHLAGEYSVKEVAVASGDWLADRPLGELRLKDEGVVALGVVHPDGTYIGAPGKDTVVSAGDVVIFYGRDSVLADVACRPAGAEGERRHRDSAQSTPDLPTEPAPTPPDSGP